MQTISHIVLLCTAMATTAQSNGGIGDRLVRTYTKYVDLPKTAQEATLKGWKPLGNGTCDPNYGIGYADGKEGLNKHNPTTLYFTPAGEASGYSVDAFGAAPPQKLIDMGFWVKVNHDQHRVGVAFRTNPCSLRNATGITLGDRVVVSPGNANHSLPLTHAEALSKNWFAGSCFEGMGTHHFYDVATAPTMSWQAENLLPVITMFNNVGAIQAIFFASWTVQEQLTNANQWEPVPLNNYLFCKNTCSHECTFAGTSWWSTYHVYFNELEQATCKDGCKISCC
eukprot:TRINITY_DN7276_c0_g5_i1.p1 TRINITY_DN7276_c0_g5~~TRINITY_DN7276_c0_g5_i1.p1  ORF type:complete len:313 (+),score=49.32 TRINITY_DN7276_c0_g5_i1:94-939(+)